MYMYEIIRRFELFQCQPKTYYHKFRKKKGWKRGN